MQRIEIAADRAVDFIDNSRFVYGRNGERSYEECPAPILAETLANTLADFAEAQKSEVVSRALRARGVSITLERYDDWDGGIWTWLARVFLSPQDWAAFSDRKERIRVQQELAELADAVVSSEAHRFTVQFSPVATSPLRGATNQGRGHSANPASIQHEGLLFRSWSEVLLYEALYDTGLPVMPLPVVISRGQRYRRIEPDFVVIRRGMTFIVEVDGDRWHQESPVAAQERLRHLEDEGVRIIRVPAENCNSPDMARQTAKDILSRIERLLESR